MTSNCYRYISEGSEVGPFALAEMQDLIARGKVNAHDLVKSGEKEWCVASAVPELDFDAAKSGVNATAYVLLGLFFGGLGIHNFYAERTKYGVIQLILALTGFGVFVSFIWAIVEICTVRTDGKGRPMR